jgi:hypothetical protein
LKTIVIDGASIINDTAFTSRYEYYSVVDKKGVVKASGLLLDELLGLTMSFDEDADLSTVTIGDYIVCGSSGTSHSRLPDECEPFLMSYVQRRVKDKMSTSDVMGENMFSTQERDDLEDLFKDNSRDIKYPVATDLDFMGV